MFGGTNGNISQNPFNNLSQNNPGSSTIPNPFAAFINNNANNKQNDKKENTSGGNGLFNTNSNSQGNLPVGNGLFNTNANPLGNLSTGNSLFNTNVNSQGNKPNATDLFSGQGNAQGNKTNKQLFEGTTLFGLGNNHKDTKQNNENKSGGLFTNQRKSNPFAQNPFANENNKKEEKKEDLFLKKDNPFAEDKQNNQNAKKQVGGLFNINNNNFGQNSNLDAFKPKEEKPREGGLFGQKANLDAIKPKEEKSTGEGLFGQKSNFDSFKPKEDNFLGGGMPKKSDSLFTNKTNENKGFTFNNNNNLANNSNQMNFFNKADNQNQEKINDVNKNENKAFDENNMKIIEQKYEDFSFKFDNRKVIQNLKDDQIYNNEIAKRVENFKKDLEDLFDPFENFNKNCKETEEKFLNFADQYSNFLKLNNLIQPKINSFNATCTNILEEQEKLKEYLTNLNNELKEYTGNNPKYDRENTKAELKNGFDKLDNIGSQIIKEAKTNFDDNIDFAKSQSDSIKGQWDYEGKLFLNSGPVFLNAFNELKNYELNELQLIKEIKNENTKDISK